MWLLVVSGMILISLGMIAFGFVPPLTAETLICFRNGAVVVTRGKLLPHAKSAIAEVLGEAGVINGFIAVVAGPRVRFSRNIPTTIHQRLRNILLNQ